MSLRSDAIKAYMKNQLEDKITIEKEKKRWIEYGIKHIKENFGDSLEIETVSGKDGGVIFIVDGLKMRLRRYQGYCHTYLIQTCPKCGADYESNIISLVNIGMALQEGHDSYDCENVLKGREPVKELTTDERLIEVLRAFVRENSSECIQ